jgi:GntR family transcriptional regulator
MHVQLRELLREKIEGGSYKFGEAIPSERKLSTMYGLNRITVRSAISALVDEGLLKKVHGKGTFVIEPTIGENIHKIQGFGKMLAEKGITPTTKLVHAEKRKAGYKYGSIFNIAENEDIFTMTRLRLGNDEAISLEETFIPLNIIPNIESVNFELYSLYDMFKATDVELDVSYESLSLVKVRNAEAKLLNLEEGSTVFSVEVRTLDVNKRIVEYTKSYTNGDKCSFYSDSILNS